MRRSFVLSLLGPDRPGVVEAVAAIISEHGGDWLESRMAHMAGEFAGILRVDVPAEQADALRQALAALAEEGLQILLRETSAETPSEGALLALELVGQDRPGIIREISQALAHSGVNVEELHTEVVSAAMSGEIMFKARAVLRLPPGSSTDTLRQQLEAVGEDLMVDIQLGSAD